jgi:hypothetical protein
VEGGEGSWCERACTFGETLRETFSCCLHPGELCGHGTSGGNVCYKGIVKGWFGLYPVEAENPEMVFK